MIFMFASDAVSPPSILPSQMGGFDFLSDTVETHQQQEEHKEEEEG